MHQRGRSEEALNLIAKALATNARSADAYANQARVLAALKRHDEAVASHDLALANPRPSVVKDKGARLSCERFIRLTVRDTERRTFGASLFRSPASRKNARSAGTKRAPISDHAPLCRQV
jgi:hypothetical protein